MIKAPDIEKTICSHCGDSCPDEHPKSEENHFCCNGCLIVWNLLHDNHLSTYYDIENFPGLALRKNQHIDYTFLDNEEIQSELIAFEAGNLKTIFLDLPDIHCTACIWLLEHLSHLEEAVRHCRVNFLQKKATIVFDSELTDLKTLFELLAKIGYPPQINLAGKKAMQNSKQDKTLIIKIAVAGFCFGNIMLLSFPDYLGNTQGSFFQHIGLLNIVLALPVLLYSAKDFFRAAWISLRSGVPGIDIPIVIGMLTLFFRSVYEIIMQTGISYLDSFTGFVFFLLIGKWYQKFSYEHIAFDRDYRSFLPLSVKIKRTNSWADSRIEDIKGGDIILIRSGELIPCDGTIISGSASVDYSFITGETEPVHLSEGSKINAGGKQIGSAIEIRVEKIIDESSLTELWKNDIFATEKKPASLVILDRIGHFFTITIIIIALATLLYWLRNDPSIAFNAFTAVLIIACPCVLALSFPFLYGNTLRLLTQKGLFVKNLNTLYQLALVDTIVFDKTGTLTDSETMTAFYEGKLLSTQQKQWIKSCCLYSHHPLSQAISRNLELEASIIPDRFEEISGSGISAYFGTTKLRIGSADFILGAATQPNRQQSFVEIDGKYLGYFYFESPLRVSISENVAELSKHYSMAVISGDNEHDKRRLSALFPNEAQLFFRQSPEDKLKFIAGLQRQGKKVLMIGDGLNDAGALQQSNVAAVIAKDNHFFTPASDIIMNTEAFVRLPDFLNHINALKKSLYGAFLLALIYNGLGLIFAVSGKLTPIVAAILMPASSLSIVVYGLIASYLIYRRWLR